MVIELTTTEADALYAAFVARFATTLTAVSAPKSEQPALAQIAAWQDGEIERVLVAAQTAQTF